MKKNILTNTLAVGTLLFAIGVKAEEKYVEKFNCVNDLLQSVLVEHKISSMGEKKALVYWNTNTRAGAKTYAAVYDSSYPNTFQYKLFEGADQVGTLTVKTVSLGGRGGFCGRAACDLPIAPVPVHSTYAALKLGEYEDSFNCK